MGITGEFVRSVFLKSRSRHDNSHGHQGSSNGVEKKKWSTSVRSHICGDEHNSVLAAEDSGSVRSSTVAEVDLTSFRSNRCTNISESGGDITSVYTEEDTVSLRSSEATVNQPLHIDSIDEKRKEKLNSTYLLILQEDAALIIQSAFRNYLARRARDEVKTDDKHEPITGLSGESVGTSVEVQTGNSSDIFSIKEESFNMSQKTHGTRGQVLKIQENWDDSTVSIVISKMRMQNRMEAATRRQKGLAYAFSQQLRICSKKKQSMINGDEMNTGWSWLERWMTARQSEINLMVDSTTSGQKTLVRKRMLDAAMKEKESCGSNEVSSLIEVSNFSVPKNIPSPTKNRIKTRSSFSGQNSASSHLCPRESKDKKKVCHIDDEKKRRKRQKQPGNRKDVKYSGTHEVPPLQHETGQ